MFLNCINLLNKEINKNKAIQRYFANISSVPEEARNSYVQKILKRKNASLQKNIKLIRIIFLLIKDEQINKWDEAKICTKLGISQNTLYWHKSNILKELRIHYFGWKEIEEKEFSIQKEKNWNASKKSAGTLEKIKLSLAKAVRMFDMGMRLEAKSILLRLIKDLENINSGKINLKKEKILLLSEALEYVIRYYHGTRNSLRFNLYYAKLKKICEKNLNCFNPKEIAEFQMRFLISQSLKSTFRVLTNSDYKEALKYLFIAYKRAKYIKDWQHLFYITIFIDEMGVRLKYKNYLQIQRCVHEAYAIATENKNQIEILTFKALIAYIQYQDSKEKFHESYFKTIKFCYNEARTITSHSSYFIAIERLLLRISADNASKEDFLKILEDLYKSNILESYTVEAWWKLYAFHSLSLDYTSFNWKLIKSPVYKISLPVIAKINYKAFSKLNDLAGNALNQYKQIFSFQIYSAVLLDTINTEFFLGKNGNYERALLFIKKRERIEKIKSVMGNNNTVIFKLGISIIENAKIHDEEYIENKFHNALVDNINYFIRTTSGVNLFDRYSVLIHIAQVTNLKFVWKLTEDFYKVLLKEIPEVINSILTGIKSHEYSKAS